ncbi:MAG: hypothetical protein OCD02_17885 [Spirochaetaceae bacterium]
MQNKMKIILQMFFLLLSLTIYSQERIVGDITIKGLKRTKPHIILETIKLKKGDVVNNLTPEDIEQSLLKAGIFDPGEILFVEIGNIIDINIDVKDKWTLLPVPIVSLTSEEQIYTGIFYEQNLFGLKKQLLLSGGYSTKDGATGGFTYMDKMFYLSGNYTRNDDEKYHNIDGSIGMLKEFDNFKIDTFLFSHNYNYDNIDNNNYLRLPIIMEYADKHYTTTAQTGYSVTLSIDPGLNLADTSLFYKNDLKLWYGVNPVNKLYFYTTFVNRTNFLSDPEELIETWGSKETSRSLIPVSATDFTGFSATAEFIFLDFNWGSISTMLSWEVGGYELREDDNFDSYTMYTGPSTGLRVYLKGLAVPALGIDYGYNIISEEHNFSLVLGM